MDCLPSDDYDFLRAPVLARLLRHGSNGLRQFGILLLEQLDPLCNSCHEPRMTDVLSCVSETPAGCPVNVSRCIAEQGPSPALVKRIFPRVLAIRDIVPLSVAVERHFVPPVVHWRPRVWLIMKAIIRF